jgi:AraC-like DNA-binding protein
LTIDHQTFCLTSQTVFLIYMYREHSIKSNSDAIIVTFRLKKSYLHQNNLFFEKVRFSHRIYTFEELAIKYRQVPLLIVQIIKLLLSDDVSDAIRYKIIGYYNVYIIDLYRIILSERYLDVKHINSDDYLNRIHTIVEYTYNHFQEKISLDDLAALTEISNYRLSHFIKEALGISYREFLQNSRFEHALKLLKETDYSVIDIVNMCGFSDHKYLNELMKDRFKTTPLKYRHTLLDNHRHTISQDSKQEFIDSLMGCLKKLEQDDRFKHLFGMNAKNRFNSSMID